MRCVAVIGGGLMGSGIATALCLAGVQVLLKEVNQQFLDGGLGRIKANLASRVGGGIGPDSNGPGSNGIGRLMWGDHAHRACCCANPIESCPQGGGLCCCRGVDAYRREADAEICTMCFFFRAARCLRRFFFRAAQCPLPPCTKDIPLCIKRHVCGLTGKEGRHEPGAGGCSHGPGARYARLLAVQGGRHGH